MRTIPLFILFLFIATGIVVTISVINNRPKTEEDSVIVQEDPAAKCFDDLMNSALTLSAYERVPLPDGSKPPFEQVVLESVDDTMVAKSANLYFNWNFEPNAHINCTYHSGWVFLQSRSPDPLYDPEGVYWHRKLGKYPFSEIVEDSPGTWYFRACYGSYEPVGCQLYSNTLKIQIP